MCRYTKVLKGKDLHIQLSASPFRSSFRQSSEGLRTRGQDKIADTGFLDTVTSNIDSVIEWRLSKRLR